MDIGIDIDSLLLYCVFPLLRYIRVDSIILNT